MKVIKYSSQELLSVGLSIEDLIDVDSFLVDNLISEDTFVFAYLHDKFVYINNGDFLILRKNIFDSCEAKGDTFKDIQKYLSDIKIGILDENSLLKFTSALIEYSIGYGDKNRLKTEITKCVNNLMYDRYQYGSLYKFIDKEVDQLHWLNYDKFLVLKE